MSSAYGEMEESHRYLKCLDLLYTEVHVKGGRPYGPIGLGGLAGKTRSCKLTDEVDTACHGVGVEGG